MIRRLLALLAALVVAVLLVPVTVARAATTGPSPAIVNLVSMTPWEEIYRSMVGQLGSGACLELATLFLNVIETRGESRNNH